MVNQSIFCRPSEQIRTSKRLRTSILPSNDLVGIEGSCWPRVLVFSESVEWRRKNGKMSCPTIKTTRRLRKREIIRQLMKASPKKKLSSLSISSSFRGSTLIFSPSSSLVATASATSDTVHHPSTDQNRSPSSIASHSSWNKPTQYSLPYKTKTSSLTGRVVEDVGTNKFAPASGIQQPLRRKPLKVVVQR